MYKKIKEQVHFIGIGGIGMSGIAEVLARQGFPVSGSDLNENDTTKRLRELGIKVCIGHSADNLAGAKVVVVSSAIKRDNPELIEASRAGLPIVARAEMLAELMRLKFGVAIAGTHGKTSTTSMVASILTHAGVDPTVVVGGKVDALGGNAKLGKGQFLVAEADESDGSFLSLSPVVTVITNIDNDHLDYYGQVEKLRIAFLEFANTVPYYGRSIVCIDDPEVAKITSLIVKPCWTYGFSKDAHFQISNYKSSTDGTRFEVLRDKIKLCDVRLSVPGRHNALNAVAALAVATELDLDLKEATTALATFRGARRRFELKGTLHEGKTTIIDDYGHHPTEIAATLEAAKQFAGNGRRIVVAFQPHRFTRTQLCWNEFAPSLAIADAVYLLDIYAAGESPIEGVNSEELANTIKRCVYSKDLQQTATALRNDLKPGDLLITLGAGSITQLGPTLLGSSIGK